MLGHEFRFFSFDSTARGLRDRALLGTLAYTFARIGAAINLKVEDYYPQRETVFTPPSGRRAAKKRSCPVYHKLEELLDQT